jgi:hypothetical protein
MPNYRALGAAAAALGVIGLISSGPALAADKHPPACSAIAFRPVPSGLTDGVQDAGLYKSRFGRIEVKAAVKSGEAQNYYVEVNGKQLGAPNGALPQTVQACAKAKRLSAPAKADGACTGDRFTVLIDHSGQQRYILLYGHRGGTWHYCSAGIA